MKIRALCVVLGVVLTGCTPVSNTQTNDELNIGGTCLSLGSTRAGARVLSVDKAGALAFHAPGLHGGTVVDTDQDDDYTYSILPLSDTVRADIATLHGLHRDDAIISQDSYEASGMIFGRHITPAMALGPRELYFVKRESALFVCAQSRCEIQFPYEGMLVEVSTEPHGGQSVLASDPNGNNPDWVRVNTDNIVKIIGFAKKKIDSFNCASH
jgi:hypothetical protein